jgi:hypothetical protein
MIKSLTFSRRGKIRDMKVRFLLAAALTLILTGCVTPTIAPTTFTPTVKSVMASTAVFPAVLTDDFFFEGLGADCQPPCWHGLIIGESTTTSVAGMFGPGFAVVNYENDPNIGMGYIRRTQQWFLNDASNPGANIAITVIAIKESEIFQGIWFFWDYSRYNRHIDPQRLIRYFGPPLQMLVAIGGGGTSDATILEVLLVFDNGIVFQGGTIIAVTKESTGSNISYTAIACLGGSDWSERKTAYSTANSLALVSPFNGNMVSLSDVQNWALTRVGGKRKDLKPAEDVFGISLDEITRLASQDTDACIPTLMK